MPTANIITARNVSTKPAAGTSFTITGDALAVSGEKLIRALCTFGDYTHTWPPGWTVLEDGTAGGTATNSHRFSVAEHTASGAVADITVSTSSGSNINASFVGVTIQSPGIITSDSIDNAASGDPTSPGVTAPVSGEDNLYMSILGWGRGSRVVVDPTGFPLPDNKTEVSGGANDNPSAAFCSDELTQDSLAAQSWDFNYGATYSVVDLVVQPAVGGGIALPIFSHYYEQ